MGRIRLYHIQATNPEEFSITPSGGTVNSVVPLLVNRKSVNKNINYKVATYNVESAIKLLKDRYPDAEITNISLKENIDDVDPQVVLEIFNSTKPSDSE